MFMMAFEASNKLRFSASYDLKTEKPRLFFIVGLNLLGCTSACHFILYSLVFL